MRESERLSPASGFRPLLSSLRMNRFDPLPSVTLKTLSAQLYPDETLILHQDGVGLYDGSVSVTRRCRHAGSLEVDTTKRTRRQER